MLKLSFAIGVYSYAIFILGLTGLLYPFQVGFITILLGLFLFFSFKENLSLLNFKEVKKKDVIEKTLFVLLLILFLVALIGALGPETAFDSLWYHLTIPKLFALHHKVYFIDGNLFYYSLFPKLTEMLYVPALILGNETIAKLIHFFFGILSCLALYKLARIYLSRRLSLLAVVAFYSNLVVMWLSTTAYTDLTRVFYETGALLYFVIAVKTSKTKNIIISILFLGFAICAKVLALGSIPIFVIMVLLIPKLLLLQKLRWVLFYIFVPILIALPWFLISFYYTKNPFYPLFTDLGLRISPLELLNPYAFSKTLVGILLFASDPISPVYFMAIPLVIFKFSSMWKKYKYLAVYSLSAFIIWYFTVQEGGARFLTVLLPAFTVLSIAAVLEYKGKVVRYMFFGIIVLVAIINVLYRGVAEAKYIPVIFGFESKQSFLMNNLNFSFGDFYDENEDIKRLVGKNRVLLINMHNLYYLNFPFTLEEFKTSQKYSYVLVQNGVIPSKYQKSKLIYINKKTHVKLYKL
jgi:4-amino-4-deoxy-L-arabinose transferase-like glycosyltransferase